MGVRAARGGGLPAEVRTGLLFILGRFRAQPFGGVFWNSERGFPIRARISRFVRAEGGSSVVGPLPERRQKSLPSPISPISRRLAWAMPNALKRSPSANSIDP